MDATVETKPTDLLDIDQAAPLVDSDGRALIDFFINDQQKLTAVEKFSLHHDAETPHLHEKYYRDLIPLSKPAKGEQYAFEVDMDACTGCKACVTACHSMNGLDDDEVWRTVGLLQGGTESAPLFQMVTSACHHCAHPACMSGCPVKAYAKDEFTGIVRHLDDQCIGCQYCVLKCPYDVPKYNPKRGIVRKCDMCSNRLAVSEAPACVQSCPNTAIKIAIVKLDEVKVRAEQNEFLPCTPEADYTQPTTRYIKKNPLPRNSLAADIYRAAPEHSHMPLVFMLVLSQLSVGAFTIDWLWSLFTHTDALGSTRPVCMAAAFGAGFVGLSAALLHLGRPLYAFRAVLGFRTSWMSREIVAFSAYLGAASGYTASFFLPLLTGFVPARFEWVLHTPPPIVNVLRIATVVTGLLGVFCSMMIYIDTRREFWKASLTAMKFGMTTVVLGLTAMIAFSATNALIGGTSNPILKQLCIVLAAATFIKLRYEQRIFKFLGRNVPYHTLQKSAVIIARDFAVVKGTRIALGIFGGMLLPLFLMFPLSNKEVALGFAPVIVTTLLIGELLERYLFFRAVVALKMPGDFSA